MKFSFVIPAYNVENYIVQCVSSIVIQVEKDKYDIEVIVVDDGSPDDLYLEVERLAKEDHRIKLIRQENRGLSGARNTGMRYASGDYLFFIDGDDFLLDGKLDDLLSFISEKQSELVLFGAQGYMEDTDAYTPFFEAVEFPEHGSLKGSDALKFLLEKDYSYGWCVWHIVFKRGLIDRTESVFPEGKVSEDVAFMLKIWLSAKTCFSYEDYVYAYRRDNGGSITHAAKFDFVLDLADNMISNIERINGLEDNLLQTLVKLNYQTLIEVILFWYSAYTMKERKMLKQRYDALKMAYDIPQKHKALYRHKEKLVSAGLKILGFDMIGRLWGLKRKRQS